MLGALHVVLVRFAAYDSGVRPQASLWKRFVEDLSGRLAEPGCNVVDRAPDAAASGAHRSCEADPIRVDLALLCSGAHEGLHCVVNAEHAPGFLGREAKSWSNGFGRICSKSMA